MPCVATSSPDRDFVGFICGDVAPKTCAFCDEAGAFLCDWPESKAERIAAQDLRVGDRLKGGTVVYAAVDGEMVWLGREFGGQTTQYGIVADTLVFVERPGTCDAACCELHARELDEERHHCMDHWRSWEAVH